MDTKNPSLIAFYSPAAQMGKSTATRLLKEGLGYRNVKFADPLKAMTRCFLEQIGVPPDQLEDFVEGHRKEEPLTEYGFDGLTTRKIMQTLGKEWGRDQIDPNLWTTIAARKARSIMSDGDRVVIDDMRFPNEYDLVKNMGGEAWCVYNPRVEIPVSGHQSEGLLANHAFDKALINDGTIEDLEKAVVGAVTRF
ncbi:hypothetical protein [Shinella zoogloeoides]|uniref:deoxynucleotide monophosphate kinase family protein n=1 Tax=Shinella zoogloeoides TaxID=352475 RepID=UPI0028B08D67|nr:hypothetical protein [Shinella zoogloeoides]